MKSISVIAILIAVGISAAQPAIQVGGFAPEPVTDTPEKTELPVRIACFPHLIAGKGWTTSFYVTNVDAGQPAIFQLRMMDPDGRGLLVPLQLNFGEPTIGSVIYGTLRPGETIVVEIAGPAASGVAYGWAELTSVSTFAGFAGYATYRNQTPEQAEQSYTVPLEAKPRTGMMLMMDNRAGSTTGAAVVNLSPYYAADFYVRVVNQDGTHGLNRVLRLAPRAQITLAIHDLFPEVKDCLAGVEFEARDSWTQMAGFGVRVGPDGQVKYLPAFSRGK